MTHFTKGELIHIWGTFEIEVLRHDKSQDKEIIRKCKELLEQQGERE